MEPTGTILLTRGEVADLLTIEECIDAVENAFKLHAEVKLMPPKVMGIHLNQGGFHIKAAVLERSGIYFVAKTNANFPGNPKLYGLPTIQGVINVSDGTNGKLLALMDSIEITILRTGAATGVAAKYLANENAKTITICGCGNQGRVSLKALMKVRSFEKVYAFDTDGIAIENFRNHFAREIDIIPTTSNELSLALRQSQVVVTCTPSRQPFIRGEDIMPGTFIAAVGADSEEKEELHLDLLLKSKIVVDLLEQCATIGELHHVLKQGPITLADVHAELGMIIAKKKPGRESEEEIIVFDSTGTALQDVAAATIVYDKALAKGIGMKIDFAGAGKRDTDPQALKNQRDISALSSFYPFR